MSELNHGDIIIAQYSGRTYLGKIYGKHIELYSRETGELIQEVWITDIIVVAHITDKELFKIIVDYFHCRDHRKEASSEVS